MSATAIPATAIPLPQPSGRPVADGILHRAFRERALRAVDELVTALSDAELGLAIAQSDDLRVLWEALHADAVHARVEPPGSDALDQRAWVRRRRKLLRAEGGTLGATEIAELLGISRQAVDKRRRAGQLLAVNTGRRGYRYPVWQLTQGGALTGLELVLDALGRFDPWIRFSFFLQPHPALGEDGRRPLDLLREGDVEPVLGAARTLGEQGGM
ncbi:MAG: hypothetical protein GXP62_17685 [Oligoflexia bacterium]|nr:hypothetical protein [Oligoflexia bacterium]